MVISYYIFIISISFLFKLSDFTEINKSLDESHETTRILNTIKESENISDLSSNMTDESNLVNNNGDKADGLTSADTSAHKSGDQHESASPDLPNLSTGSGTNESAQIIDANGDATQRSDTGNLSAIIGHAQSPQAVDSNVTQSTTDDMPTFDEYRQKLEMESKQKREKADSIPSSPTMIVKDKSVVKATADATVAKSSTGREDSTEPVGSSPPITTETKSHGTVETVERGTGHSGDQKEEVKLDLRTATLTKKLLKNNVAAKECGAKVLDYSRQITNADHVLNSNKDEYLNVPCSLPEKWFVVETCEPVQIRSLQIANFEMFSSRPKTFKVYSSDRYPVKHWYTLGSFRAHDEKGIQTFTISDSNMVKYIKFEMVDYYGNEHYCPLTFVRILGNVVIDEIDEEAEYTEPSMDEDAPIDNSNSKIDSDGILTKAKDILVKMVHGIGGSKKQDLDESIEDLSNRASKYDENLSDTVISESPCYFIDFLTKGIQLNWDKAFVDFQQFHEMGKYLTFDNNMTMESFVISLPFPFQIRVNYFSIHRLINNYNFQFNRLYRSFCNLTRHSPRDIGSEEPWENLRSLFKCNLIINTKSRVTEPSFPKIMPNLPVFQEVPIHIPPTVNIPEIKTSDQVTDDVHKGQQPPGQNEPSIVNGQTKSPSTSTLPVLSLNETASEEPNYMDKNATIDSTNKDVRVNKTSPPPKDLEIEKADNINKTSVESPSKTKLKSDEMIFDQKFSASPGSNAWNQAFMRIKNMAKQLEINVTISMKYLEELSQNYKQQTERLKKAQFSMGENVSALENLIHQYRHDTQSSFKHFNIQLQGIILKLKYGFSTTNQMKSKINLSDIAESEVKCVDLLTEELFVYSWTDSPYFMVFINVMFSMLCNLIVLALLYNRLKVKIISEVMKSTMSSSMSANFNPNLQFSYIDDLSMYSFSRSCSDLTNPGVAHPHPVVLPPRGVNLSFTNPKVISDCERTSQNTLQKELGPHFYPVQPNLNFVTPSKDRKKKRKK